jgi:DUF1009 family protein
MGNRLGIIASSGDLPSLIIEKAQKNGFTCVVAAIEGHTDRTIEDVIKPLRWFELWDIAGVISYYKANGVTEVVFAGKIDPRVIYNKEQFDPTALQIVDSGEDKKPASVIEKVIFFLEEQGLSVIDPTPFLSSFYCEEGVLTTTQPSDNIKSDIEFGWDIARNIAELDIGQTLVVKDRAIVAVEGMEGTDETIKRGGYLAGEGTTVVKVSRMNQDPRIDLPALGVTTVQSLVEAKSSAICFEADKMPFFQKQEALSLADENGISIIAK